MKELILLWVGLVVGLCLLFVAIFFVVSIPITAFNAQACSRYAQLDPKHDYDFSYFGGCLVKSDEGRWVPYGQWVGVTK